jgi:hypothetical protein
MILYFAVNVIGGWCILTEGDVNVACQRIITLVINSSRRQPLLCDLVLKFVESCLIVESRRDDARSILIKELKTPASVSEVMIILSKLLRISMISL